MGKAMHGHNDSPFAGPWNSRVNAIVLRSLIG
jgi:hypothetical protein